MVHRISVLVVVSGLFVSACGGSAAPTKVLSDVQKPAASPAKPAETAAADASTKPDQPAPKAESKAAEAFTGEDPGKTVTLSGERGWSIGPGDTWDPGLYEFVRTEGTKNVFKVFGGEGEFSVPGSFTFPATAPKALKKGDPVFATIVTGGVCSRVISVSDDQVKVAFDWANELSDRTFSPEELLLLDGKLGYASPVIYKEAEDDGGWIAGTLIYKNEKTAWLAGNKQVPAALVKPMDVNVVRKVGDKVLGIHKNAWGFLELLKITKVIHDGLEYEVEYPDGEKKIAGYCSVTSPVK